MGLAILDLRLERRAREAPALEFTLQRVLGAPASLPAGTIPRQLAGKDAGAPRVSVRVFTQSVQAVRVALATNQVMRPVSAGALAGQPGRLNSNGWDPNTDYRDQKELSRLGTLGLRTSWSHRGNMNPAIQAEFAHAVYRFGHSMLDDDVARKHRAVFPAFVGFPKTHRHKSSWFR